MTRILDEEIIQWIAAADALPDDETIVLIYSPEVDEPVWLGYYDGDGWDNADGMPCAPESITAWARMPSGPNRGST